LSAGCDPLTQAGRGIATNVCVESTLRGGFYLEYFFLLLDDAKHRAGPDFVRQAAVFNVEAFFWWVGMVVDRLQGGGAGGVRGESGNRMARRASGGLAAGDRVCYVMIALISAMGLVSLDG